MEEIIRVVIVAVLPLLMAITFHEVAHGFVANRMGDPTARDQGRLSLNPLKHLDPLGTVILPLLLIISRSPFIFGYAKPVPVNPMYLKDPRRDMMYVAAAGPGSNFLLALLSGLLFRVITIFSPASVMAVMRESIYASPQGTMEMFLVPLALMLQFSTRINILLGLFNLIPIPPLDGGRILTGILPHDLADSFARVERYGMLILLALLFFDPFGIMSRFIGTGIHILSSLFLGM